MLNSDMSLHAYDTRGRWHHLTVKTAEKSCTVKGNSQFHECKTKEKSTLHQQFVLRTCDEDLNVITVCSWRAESGPADCPVERKHSLHFVKINIEVHCVSKLIDDYG